MPVQPPPCAWELPDPRGAEGDLIGIGADLAPGTLLEAYRTGLFPMPVEDHLAWWSPDPRGILPIDGVRVSRSLRRSCARFDVRVDTAFGEVVTGCAAPDREGAWIDDPIIDAYLRLHALGWAHSVEAWEGDELAGGLYGVAINGLFAGESMFHHATDASKVALVALVSLLDDGATRLLDVQWSTPHLATLGVVEVRRDDYLRRLRRALESPLPSAFNGGP